MALAVAGCERRPSTLPPQTFSVRGKVLDNAGQAVAGGAIQFRPVASGVYASLVELKTDGTFVLSTMADGVRLVGAVEGSHEITYFPKLTESQAEVPVTLPKPVTVEPKDDNFFTITLP